MGYSSIIQKMCKCGCGKYPTMGFQGFNSECRPDLKEALINKHKKRTAEKNASNKLRNVDENKDVNREMSKGYAELERWFKERQKEMTGRCMNCGGKTEAHTKMYKCSIAHILPKAYFPSVATHPDNWIELCFYSNSCHTNFDNKMLDLLDMNCFDQIIKKFAKMYPHIAQEEKRRIPAILIEYLKTEL